MIVRAVVTGIVLSLAIALSYGLAAAQEEEVVAAAGIDHKAFPSELSIKYWSPEIEGADELLGISTEVVGVGQAAITPIELEPDADKAFKVQLDWQCNIGGLPSAWQAEYWKIDADATVEAVPRQNVSVEELFLPAEALFNGDLPIEAKATDYISGKSDINLTNWSIKLGRKKDGKKFLWKAALGLRVNRLELKKKLLAGWRAWSDDTWLEVDGVYYVAFEETHTTTITPELNIDYIGPQAELEGKFGFTRDCRLQGFVKLSYALLRADMEYKAKVADEVAGSHVFIYDNPTTPDYPDASETISYTFATETTVSKDLKTNTPLLR